MINWMILIGTIQVIVIGIGLFGVGMEVQAQNSTPEIDINQEITVDDEIIKTIHVQLEDGIASSDDIR